MPTAPDLTLALRLLKDNVTLPVGYYCLAPRAEGKFDIILEAELSVEASTEVAQAIITQVALTADKLELELTGKDEF